MGTLTSLLDPDSPFLGLSTLAAWGTGFTVGASELTGIGVVPGVECVVIAHDPVSGCCLTTPVDADGHVWTPSRVKREGNSRD